MSKISTKIKEIWQSDRWSVFLVFLLFFGVFLALQLTFDSLTGYDPFYHIKLAWLISREGFIDKMPWLDLTILRDNFVDFHFLFHLFLVPFVFIGQVIQDLRQGTLGVGGGPEVLTEATAQNLIWAGKAAVATLCGAVFASFFGILRKLRIKFDFFWTVFLAIAAESFLYRISLLKAPVFSLAFIFIGFYLIIKSLDLPAKAANKYYYGLAALCFAFVWFYAGALIFGVFALAFFCFQWALRKKPPWKMLAAAAAGLAAGVVINPYFPENIQFYYVQSLVAGLGSGEISVGNEWYPYKWDYFFSGHAFVFAFWILSSIIFIYSWIRYRAKQKLRGLKLAKSLQAGVAPWSLLAVSLIALGLFLRSRRFVEFFVPLAFFSAAFSFNYFWQARREVFDAAWAKARKWRQRLYHFIQEIKAVKAVRVLAAVALALFVANFAVIAYQKLWENLQGSQRPEKFAGVGHWLTNNVPEKTVVFNTDWDDFPLLFFSDTRHYYLTGLDPTFTYLYDRELYELWVKISNGQESVNLADKIKARFHTSYVVTDKDHTAARANFDRAKGFEKVYEDQYASIYRIK